MSEMIKALYPCSMMDMYSVVETAWGNFGNHIARFTSFKPLYTPAFKTAALAALTAAKALPDDDARSGSSIIMHIGVVNMGNVCLQNFQFLKRYIETAYTDTEVQNALFVVAGQNYYRAASREDWESMISMNTNAKNYLSIPANVTALTANNNMPAAFVTTLKNASDAFDVQYANFKITEETSVETAAKIKANNACYNACMAMLRDAQTIFMNEPEILTKFVFSNLLALINPPVAGVKGNIKEVGTNAVISNATLSVQKDGEPAQSLPVDVNGDFGSNLAEGPYKIVVGAPNYVEQVFEMNLKLSGLKTLNVELVKTV